jgi:eukaryotic-like serine/threonine-protein kinase
MAMTNLPLFTPAPGASALAPGTALGQYELLFFAGRGGMGEVWCARSKTRRKFGEVVAIKVLAPEFVADAERRGMFLSEASLAARVQHPNVATMIEAGQEGATTYLVFEWVFGDTLSRLLRALDGDSDDPTNSDEEHTAKSGPPPAERISIPILLRIVADVCAGLHAAHETRAASGESLELVHRDIKPGNIMIGVDGVVRLIDFGIARSRDREHTETRTGIIKGTPRYMSPEQALQEPLDRRSDVWSMGVILYYLLSGTFPYGNETEVRVLLSICAGKPMLPLPESVPHVLRAIVMRALTMDRNLRQSSAKAMRDDILAYLESINANPGPEDVARAFHSLFADRFNGHQSLIRETQRWTEDAPTRLSLPLPAFSMPEGLMEPEALREHTQFLPARVTAESNSGFRPVAMPLPAPVARQHGNSKAALWALALGAMVIAGVLATVGTIAGFALLGPGASDVATLRVSARIADPEVRGRQIDEGVSVMALPRAQRGYSPLPRSSSSVSAAAPQVAKPTGGLDRAMDRR